MHCAVGLASIGMALLLSTASAVKLQSAYQPSTLSQACWRDSYYIGANYTPSLCPSGSQPSTDGSKCLANCKSGYSLAGSTCYQNCPLGFTDDGHQDCVKPQADYNRIGYETQQQCVADHPSGCSSLCGYYYGISICSWYTNCSQGFIPFGNTGTCTQQCPSGFADGNAYCSKPSYAASIVSAICYSGSQLIKGVCVPSCQAPYVAQGPICVQQCPSIVKTNYCGQFLCTVQAGDCTSTVQTYLTWMYNQAVKTYPDPTVPSSDKGTLYVLNYLDLSSVLAPYGTNYC